MTEQHADYLHILGVQQINFLFDTELSEQGSEGAALTAIRLKKWGKPFTTQSLYGLARDPSEALQIKGNAEDLKFFLERDLRTSRTARRAS